MAHQDFSANHNLLIKEITEKNRLHLRKLAGMDNLNNEQEEEKMSERIRWYAHGDAGEGQPGLYFCASCDCFKPESHFLIHADNSGASGTKHRANNYEKYDQSMKAWKIRYSKLCNYTRPKSTHNLFS